jgi:hypothetical protein
LLRAKRPANGRPIRNSGFGNIKVVLRRLEHLQTDMTNGFAGVMAQFEKLSTKPPEN